MTKDLTWTGNQFLDRRTHVDEVIEALDGIDVTSKGDVWGESVAAAAAGHFGVPEPFVRVGAGATQLIEACLRTLYRGLIVDVTPNFHLTATLSAQEGWAHEAVPVREPEELNGALEPFLDRPEAIVSLSSPRNPLGYQFPLDDVEALLERARGTVIVDEVYADFAADTALRLVREHERLVVIRTFSKAWGLANLRIGFAVSAAFARDDLALRILPNSTSGIAQRAAKHVLAHPEAVRRSIDDARFCRARMIESLSGIDGLHVWPSDANYVCVETPAAEDVVAALGEDGYAVRLVNSLRGYPPSWPAGLRITVPPLVDVEGIVERIRECHEAVCTAEVPAK
jgi:histidinol-phosphate aminotransferase